MEQLYRVERQRVENCCYPEQRAAENVRQWGVRAKIDVQHVKKLAAILKSKQKPAPKSNTRIGLPPNYMQGWRTEEQRAE